MSIQKRFVVKNGLDNNNLTIINVANPVNDQDVVTKAYGVSSYVAKTGDTMTGTLVLHANPTNPLEAATKSYVDGVAQGVAIKPAVLAATTANLTGTYDNGTLGVGATIDLGLMEELIIDDVTIDTLYQGILVKDQTNTFENGRYYLSQIGNDVDTSWILTRCGYCDEAHEIPSMFVFVQSGTLNIGSGMAALVENPTTFTVGVDGITFTQFSGAGSIYAGDGLESIGNYIHVKPVNTDRLTVSTSGVDLANSGVTPGEYNRVTVDTYGRVTSAINPIAFENDILVTQDYDIATNKNAVSAGPIAINSGITVTVPNGSTWTIV